MTSTSTPRPAASSGQWMAEQQASTMYRITTDFWGGQVRKTPSWPRSWANFSLLLLHSHRNTWTNLHLLGHLTPFLLQGQVFGGLAGGGGSIARASLHANASLLGANGTFPDLDMLPMGQIRCG